MMKIVIALASAIIETCIKNEDSSSNATVQFRTLGYQGSMHGVVANNE
jgi:hypothetical protein